MSVIIPTRQNDHRHRYLESAGPAPDGAKQIWAVARDNQGSTSDNERGNETSRGKENQKERKSKKKERKKQKKKQEERSRRMKMMRGDDSYRRIWMGRRLDLVFSLSMLESCPTSFIIQTVTSPAATGGRVLRSCHGLTVSASRRISFRQVLPWRCSRCRLLTTSTEATMYEVVYVVIRASRVRS